MASIKTNIFIPTKIKVGYNKRNDCYTGKLAYVIYWKDNEWKQSNSWEGWIEKYATEDTKLKLIENYNKRVENNIKNNYHHEINKIDNFNDLPNYYKNKYQDDASFEPKEFTNELLEGYVLNKKAGGYDTGWNHRQTYCRVYDPRGFEFEITIENLLYILENTNSIVGKGLEGKFILGWVDKKIVLIPEKSPDYKNMMLFTTVQSNRLSTKDLKEGCVYITKSLNEKVYLGKHIEYSSYFTKNDTKEYKTKKYFWYDIKYDTIETTASLSSISHKKDDTIYDDYSTVFEKLELSPIYSPYDESKFIYEKINFDEIDKYSYCCIKYFNEYYSIYINFDKNEKSFSERYGMLTHHYDTIYLDGMRINIPKNLNKYNYIVTELGGFYKQRKFLKNGKEVK